MTARRELANAIRALSMDSVQQAKSGHPGMPMGMADIAEVLWNDFLTHDPNHPRWWNRDRFILSNGHGSMLHYALLHLTGYALTLEDLRQFRQLHSKTPGHPEYGYTPGVETTTGPLGQGLANGVGIALAERHMAATFNRGGIELFNHYTYVFAGDGCMMEGVSHEACSLAGTLGLGKLIVFWDNNGISIDGAVQGWFTENVPQRFEAYGWHVVRDVDGHDSAAIKAAIEAGHSVEDKPTLIDCRTVIGYGAPNLAGGHQCHGAALGEVEVAAARENMGWDHPPFVIPDAVYAGWDAKAKGADGYQAWQSQWARYEKNYPELAEQLTRRMAGALPQQWTARVTAFLEEVQQTQKTVATRKASQDCLDAYGPLLPELIGGSADLTGSNNTYWKGSKVIAKNAYDGNYIHFGVREFAMTALCNGLALYGGLIPYSGTFLVFSDYARNAVRLAALMEQRTIFVYTHDSLGLGEDGPTHQPVEHAAMLRLTPNVSVWRPCDSLETAVAWQQAIERRAGPTALLLSRQNLPYQARSQAAVEAIQRGGYILSDSDGKPEVILIATGSEVALAMEAANLLKKQGRQIRVVSLPCTDVFDAQEPAYRDRVLPPAITARVAIEAGSADYWYKYVGLQGSIVGLRSFGASGPAQHVFADKGFTVAHVVREVEGQIASLTNR